MQTARLFLLTAIIVLYRVKKIVIESAVDSDSSSESEGEEFYERAWE